MNTNTSEQNFVQLKIDIKFNIFDNTIFLKFSNTYHLNPMETNKNEEKV